MSKRRQSFAFVLGVVSLAHSVAFAAKVIPHCKNQSPLSPLVAAAVVDPMGVMQSAYEKALAAQEVHDRTVKIGDYTFVFNMVNPAGLYGTAYKGDTPIGQIMSTKSEDPPTIVGNQATPLSVIEGAKKALKDNFREIADKSGFNSVRKAAGMPEVGGTSANTGDNTSSREAPKSVEDAGKGEIAKDPGKPTTLVQSSAPQSDIAEYKYGGYTFKLMSNGQTGQVFEGMRSVGSIYTANSKQEVMPTVPEPEASRIKQAFAEWKASGKTGSTAPPEASVSFESDGSAVVPLQDGTIVTFKPTSIEVNQPNALAVVPGQAPVTNVKFLLQGPGFGKQLFGSHSGIFMNGKEVKDWAGFNNGGRKSAKTMYYYLKPLLEGPVTKAADLASTAPNKPANALDYRAPIPGLVKRVE